MSTLWPCFSVSFGIRGLHWFRLTPTEKVCHADIGNASASIEDADPKVI